MGTHEAAWRDEKNLYPVIFFAVASQIAARLLKYEELARWQPMAALFPKTSFSTHGLRLRIALKKLASWSTVSLYPCGGMYSSTSSVSFEANGAGSGWSFSQFSSYCFRRSSGQPLVEYSSILGSV